VVELGSGHIDRFSPVIYLGKTGNAYGRTRLAC
jgi:hypothetical protein